MDVTEAIFDSWDRQDRIVNAVATRVDDANKNLKPSEDGWPLFHQLAHMYKVRQSWLTQYSPRHAEGLPDVGGWGVPSDDLVLIKGALVHSGRAVRAAVADGIASGGGPSGGYDNPIVFLQHMVWHDGWHVGLIFLAMRLGGLEPTEEWEEANVWGEWRVEEF